MPESFREPTKAGITAAILCCLIGGWLYFHPFSIPARDVTFNPDFKHVAAARK